MTSDSGHDERDAAAAAGTGHVVPTRPGRHRTPSPGDRAAIVRGSALDLTDATQPRRAGERREGPTKSWWRTQAVQAFVQDLMEEYAASEPAPSLAQLKRYADALGVIWEASEPRA